jgi:hypothetical protein
MKNTKLIEAIQSVLCYPEYFKENTHEWARNCFCEYGFNAEDLALVLENTANVQGFEKAKQSLEYELFLLDYQEEEEEQPPFFRNDEYDNYFIQFKL